MDSTFMALEKNLNANINTNSRNAAWRQQSLIIKSMNETVAKDLMERHWLQSSLISGGSNEIPTHSNNLLSNDDRFNIKFPNIAGMNFPNDTNASIEMFNDTKKIDCCQQTIRANNPSLLKNTSNNFLESSCTPRNTMEKFLQSHKTDEQQSSFCSARQMLDVQTLKKNIRSDGIMNQQSSFNIQHTPHVGFNFSATKKSLGSLGRLVNSSRKNFVSPIRNITTTSISDSNEKKEEMVDNEMMQLLSHPALKNIDSKMVELINNEIIHKFKPVDWNAIAGLEYAKSIIKEAVVYPLLRPDIFTGLRRPPRGILLFGPPGTGKTLIGKCIASQSSSTFFSISSSSLTSKWMGEGEKMVRALFGVAVARQPSVIFLDEIDSLLSQRSENENEGTRRLKTEFLVRLDGAATSDDERVLIVGATNRPQELDEAVRRRFVKRLYIPLPEKDAREVILTNLLKTVENNLDSNNIKEISELAKGYSGADMDSLCREASMEPLRSLPAEAIITFQKEHLRPVNIDDFHSALKKIRPSVSQSDLNQYVEWNKTYGSSF